MPECSVACGHCCLFWREVFPEHASRDKCPYLTHRGCWYSYENRPNICRDFICPLGAAAGKVSNKAVQDILDALCLTSAETRREIVSALQTGWEKNLGQSMGALTPENPPCSICEKKGDP